MATDGPPQNIAAAVADISERVALLVHEEIALARAEIEDKAKKVLRGVAVGVAAGIFAVVGLLFLLHGFAWLAWYVLPVGQDAIFVGYFFVAGVLFLMGGLAGYLAFKFFKDSSPPVPAMAIEEAGKIRKTLKFRKKD